MKYLFLSLVLVGCGQKAPPHKSTQSYLQVTSPPTQVTMIVPKEVMNDEFICKVTREVKRGKYYNYPFNATKSIILTADVERHLSDSVSDVESDTSSLSVSLD